MMSSRRPLTDASLGAHGCTCVKNGTTHPCVATDEGAYGGQEAGVSSAGHCPVQTVHPAVRHLGKGRGDGDRDKPRRKAQRLPWRGRQVPRGHVSMRHWANGIKSNVIAAYAGTPQQTGVRMTCHSPARRPCVGDRAHKRHGDERWQTPKRIGMRRRTNCAASSWTRAARRWLRRRCGHRYTESPAHAPTRGAPSEAFGMKTTSEALSHPGASAQARIAKHAR